MARVLIIDDNNELRALLIRTLKAAGHDVDEAPDGRAGVQAFTQQPHDVALCDIFMPKQDGFETNKELRRLAPDLRIIGMTGGGAVGTMDLVRMAAAMGAWVAVTKPFSMEEITELVRRAVEEQ